MGSGIAELHFVRTKDFPLPLLILILLNKKIAFDRREGSKGVEGKEPQKYKLTKLTTTIRI
jgi:hypothetical protein